MNRTIEDDTQYALTMLNLDITDVILPRGSRSIMQKKVLLYCYLRLECGYSWHEIGTHCNKHHTTILKVVNKHKVYYGAVVYNPNIGKTLLPTIMSE